MVTVVITTALTTVLALVMAQVHRQHLLLHRHLLHQHNEIVLRLLNVKKAGLSRLFYWIH